jgi:hypothetical protein
VPSSKQIDKLLSSFSQLNLIHERDIYLGQEIYHPKKKSRREEKSFSFQTSDLSLSSCLALCYIVVDLLCYRSGGVIVWEKKKNTMSFPRSHHQKLSCTVVGLEKL